MYSPNCIVEDCIIDWADRSIDFAETSVSDNIFFVKLELIKK